MTVLVVGSLNMDLVARSPQLPRPGETITGHDFLMIPGGKGANQAVAVARWGVPTTMLGRLGSDSFGEALIDALKDSGVQCDRILNDPETHSGVAMIAVDDQAENHIIVIPGANGRVSPSDLDRVEDLWSTVSIALLQLEIPLDAVTATAQVAKERGAQVILDPAPAPDALPDNLYALIDILTPNQVEAEKLTGMAIQDEKTALHAAKILQNRGVKTVIIKLGAQGSFCLTQSRSFLSPAFSVQAIDTVAAGDAFNGGLAAALVSGKDLEDAIAQATATAALSVTRSGAQTSMPTQSEVEEFIKTIGK